MKKNRFLLVALLAMTVLSFMSVNKVFADDCAPGYHHETDANGYEMCVKDIPDRPLKDDIIDGCGAVGDFIEKCTDGTYLDEWLVHWRLLMNEF